MNQTLMRHVKYMRLSKQFWREAVNLACHMVNRSPSTIIDLKTPKEVWSTKASDYSSLCRFVCPSYAHVNDGKMKPMDMKCIFLAYVTILKGY